MEKKIDNVKIHPYFHFFYQEKDNKVVWMFPTVQDVFLEAYRKPTSNKELLAYFNNFGYDELVSKLSVLYWMFRDNDSIADLLYLYLHNNCIPEGVNPIDEFSIKTPYGLFDKLGRITKHDIDAFIDRRMEYIYMIAILSINSIILIKLYYLIIELFRD